MISKMSEKLASKEKGIVPGPGVVHISTYPLMGGVLKPKVNAEESAKDDFSVDDCMKKNAGKVNNPGAYCASVKDKIVGDTHWRGKEESNSGSTIPQVLRKQESLREGAAQTITVKDAYPRKTMEIRSRFREAVAPSGGNKFKVVLIQEGLGNFKSAFYYTKECLQASAALFEGKKCYADHPSLIEEQTRPERSTRDILGYFEGVAYAEDSQGRGMLEANLCLDQTEAIDWARSLLTNSLEYSKKYQDKDFVGLSINASGEADPADIDDFIKSSNVPEAAIPKLLEAKEQGIDQVQVVKALKDAVSCDLVTEAGAGGKILSMIESQKGKSMKKKVNENEMKHAGPPIPKDAGKGGPLPVKDHEADPMPPAKDGDGHDDADQDKALFAKMIKQYLGDDHEGDEEVMKMAKHAYQAHREDGMEHEAAYEAAGKHLKMAMNIGKKMAQDGEAHEAKEDEAMKQDESKMKQEEAKEEEAKKESAASHCRNCITLAAQLSKAKESIRTIELNQYLEKKCQESKLPVKVTKEARTVLGTPKSKEHIDTVLDTFKRVHQSALEDAGSDSWFLPEKQPLVESASKSKIGSFSDCKGN